MLAQRGDETDQVLAIGRVLQVIASNTHANELTDSRMNLHMAKNGLAHLC